jgi:hypothetical protein
MHCPTCGYDNPLTTRFCAGCGIVLVEDASARPIRKRLLRRKKPTPQPALPIELVDDPAELAQPSTAGRSSLAARALVAIVAGVSVAGIAFYVTGPMGSTERVAATRSELVPLPVASSARVPNTGFAATSAAIDVVPVPGSAQSVSKSPVKRVAPRATVPTADPKERDIVPAPAAEPERVAAVAERAVAAPAPAVDRWTRVQQEIARCGEQGVLERVFCVERVRHANCEGYWGQVSSCPGAQVVDYPR